MTNKCDVCGQKINERYYRKCCVCGLRLCKKCFYYSGYDFAKIEDQYCKQCFELCEPFFQKMNSERENFDCIINKIESEMIRSCKKSGIKSVKKGARKNGK